MKAGPSWTWEQLRRLLNVPEARWFRYAHIGGRDCLEAVVPGEPPRPVAITTDWRCKNEDCGHCWEEPGDCRHHQPNCPKCAGEDVERGEHEPGS